ncbi:Sensor_kinase_SpoOB-type, alpha-helical domain [Alkalithermobacter thermoalcaliphilus JW-YL-7 = DSM 7308]|uniref:Sensor_kinase_SpoOB-type, alpha-helical domain n=1 Tax=Alkalithermobacter thermoalcaliphilus JW-YL-7 = DSM 7308 TaxID=1121328 RepID=A0A150FRA2_CLOPD|nr:signal transduction histidine kinase regulating citrate/malate metabolism [[Clostridium] paradoxum JW-YL-7 = DSM 7308]SHL03067.1 Sensor_kinase_SpoOB-type, alpha-helical domain [[Clostridium] paradoxum JW-YL-7 = DSM 7308]
MNKDYEIKLHYWELIEKILREQRHDFLNEIQIIYGYIRLNKMDKAIEYINKCSKNAKIISKLSNLNCLELYLMLCDKFKEASNLGISIDFDVYSCCSKEDIVDKNLDVIVSSFEKIINIIIQCMYTNLYFEEQIFYIQEDKDRFIFKTEIYDDSVMSKLRSSLENFNGVFFKDRCIIYEAHLS